MTQLTITSRPIPQTPVDTLGHLVTHHGWDPQPADPSMIQAHRYAHGIDGRPDLADPRVNHGHAVSATPSTKTNRWTWAAATFVVFAICGLLIGSGNAEIITGLYIFAAIVGAYFLPTIVAAGRHHHNVATVAIVNVFLGWTFIGWVVALAMAASSVRSADRL
jgi:hypothetical protein